MPRNPPLAAVTNGTINWKEKVAGMAFSICSAAVAFAVAWGALSTNVNAAITRLDYQRSQIESVRLTANEAKVDNAAVKARLDDIAHALDKQGDKLDRLIEVRSR